MKQNLISLVFVGLAIAFTNAPVSSPANQVVASSSQPQGYSPGDIRVTQDGQYAYLGFYLSEVVFKVRLTDLAIVATADMSAYFPMGFANIALDASEKKLFVYAPIWRKLLVLDTETMSIIHAMDDYDLTGMVRSQFGSRLITWGGGATVDFINSDTYAVTQHTNDSLFFLKIQEHPDDQTKLYVATQGLPGGQGPLTVGLYDYAAKSWINSVTFSLQAAGEGIGDFRVLPNGQKAYLTTFGGWYPDYHAYGWLYVIDLVTKQSKAVAIDGGASCLEANSAGTRLYVGTGWPQPSTNNLLVVDTTSDSVVGSIPLGTTKYGWNYTQMDDLQIDSAHPNILYATSADGNAFVKVDIDSLTLADVRILNNESLRPHFFVRRPTQAFGNILVQSAISFELNLDNAAIQNSVTFPSISQDTAAYDICVLNTGRLLIGQADRILDVDPQSMQIIATHTLPVGTAISNFILSNDKTKIYAVISMPGPDGTPGTPNNFVVLDTTTFQVEKQLTLAGGIFEFRPFVLPDDSKIYALGGMQNGAVVVHVISAADYTIQKTVTYDHSDRPGIAAGPNYPYAYDPVSHILFVGATYVVLAIDTTTDEIKKVIYLGDVTTAIGLQSGDMRMTFLNAVGLVYHPTENYLYIAHLDRSFVSIYDLTNDLFLPKLIPLKGYFPYMLFANDAYDKIYSINKRSDSVSVIDVSAKTVVNVIDLLSLTNAPQNVVASDGAYTDKVALTWSAVSDATSYEVWRHTNNNSSAASKVSISDLTGTSYDDATAAADTTYYYWVKAVNTAGASVFSASDSGYIGRVGPLITANGMVGEVFLNSGDTVTIAVQMMNIEPYLGIAVDWWVVAYAHSGEWYYLSSALQWMPFNGIPTFCQPVYQGALFNLSSTPALERYQLPRGTYDFWFAIDYPLDGILNLSGPILYDKVTVVVR